MQLISILIKFKLIYQITYADDPLQNAGGLGRVLKNAAQNCLKPRFLKTGLKDKRPSRVF